jgi:exodeoxyribonuclease VII large subunit
MSDSANLQLENPVLEKNKVLSIEQLNRQIRQLVEGQLGVIWVRGEISNFKAHTSGHFYFSLKDQNSQIRAVMFRGHNSRLRFKPKDGLEVIVRGKISVYEPRGDYQIVCEMMEPVGAGALQRAFEDLKLKLKNEGLFESARKRAIPPYPRHVAIVTSPTGAAIQDILNILNRRNKTVRITLVPTLVQGEGAANKICDALKKAFMLADVDAVIIGRGGGSIEDLWAFNDENLARLIFTSPVPVISAVGHEIDFTICDFVADLRAPTPSAAAELVVKNAEDLQQRIKSLNRLLNSSLQRQMKTDLHRLRAITAKLVDPRRRLQDLIQKNDELIHRLRLSFFRYIEKQKTKLRSGMAVLDSLSPLRVVERGYSVVLKGQELIKNSAQVKIGEQITVVLAQGVLQTEVKELKEKESQWILKKN